MDEVTAVTEQTVSRSKKEFVWVMDGIEFKISNVPCERLDKNSEEVVDLEVAIKIEMLRELMIAKRIPQQVNYEVVAKLPLDF
ncbi:hypothetical protein ACQKGA_28270 [Priestia megaterium]|uniref:hypothetical protein n=1 Tax=Priestia megaterium TaxID=1404 RepID=UPI003CFD5052